MCYRRCDGGQEAICSTKRATPCHELYALRNQCNRPVLDSSEGASVRVTYATYVKPGRLHEFTVVGKVKKWSVGSLRVELYSRRKLQYTRVALVPGLRLGYECDASYFCELKCDRKCEVRVS